MFDLVCLFLRLELGHSLQARTDHFAWRRCYGHPVAFAKYVNM